MRKHRTFEKNNGVKLTIQSPCLTPRQLMNLLSQDIQVDLKARSGTYGNGSESFPIPRNMSIAKLAQMTPVREKPVVKPVTPPVQDTPPEQA